MVMIISLLSLTRTVFLAFGALFLMYLNEARKLLREVLAFMLAQSMFIKSSAVLLSFLLIVGGALRVRDRVFLSLFAFSENGGVTTRIQQYTEALDLIAIRPLFGHGVGMYPAALYHWFPEGTVLYFPEKVHNAFLLIAAESGLISLAIAIVLLLSIMRVGFTYLDKRLVCIWFVYNTLYLLLQPVAHSILAMGNVFILALVEYEKTKK
jgi:O-antigen ligase